jgi:hypothetical protein
MMAISQTTGRSSVAQTAIGQDDEEGEQQADRIEMVKRHRHRMVRPGA